MNGPRPHDLTRYKHGPDADGTPGRGCRCPECRAANTAWVARRARMIAYGQWDGWADAAGTRRRIQALMRNGWSIGLLAARLGCNRETLRVKLSGRARLMPATVDAVRVLYRDLWDLAPPERTREERRAATMARDYARVRGWVPPCGWDDSPGPYFIDDPAARAAPGSRRREVS